MPRTLWMLLAVALPVGLAVTLGCQPPPADATAAPVRDEAPPDPPAPAPEADRKALAEGSNRFALELYKAIAAEQKGNVFLSPYSISAALAMTYAGARGDTAAQMAKVLGIDNLGERVHPAHADLARRLKGDGAKGRPEFHIANSLWGQKGLPFERDFLKLTKAHYGAGLREVDYIADCEAARAEINKWVSEQTRDMIPNLLAKEDVPAQTKLILVNAIYFKGLWATPFQVANTKPAPFWTTPDTSADVPTMRQSIVTSFHEGKDFKAVSLPCGNGPFGMVVVVPDARDGVQAIERKLTPDAIRSWFTHDPAAEVDLHLPVFKSKAQFKLGRTLIGLGMKRAFANDADFSGIAPRTALRLAISEVIHEAVVEVNEEGTKAAAATAVVMYEPVRPPVRPRQVTLRADRPFLYLIVDHTDGTILLLGRYTGP